MDRSAALLVRARRIVPPWARRMAGRLFPLILRWPTRDPIQTHLTLRPHPQTLNAGRRRDSRRSPARRWELFRASLRLPGVPDVRAALLDELSTYSGRPPEECVERCRNWESWSVEEWSAADRSDMDGLASFYQTTQSWAFDLLWFAYLQAEGYGYPTSVLALRTMAARGHGRAHLDFGSGVGVTSQLFARAGYETTLADISTSLLTLPVTDYRATGRRPGSLTSTTRSLRPVGTTSSPRSTRSSSFLIWRTSWPTSTARSGQGGCCSPTSMYVPSRPRMPGTSTKTTSTFGRSCTVRASYRPAASGSRPAASASGWCIAVRTLRAQSSGSGCYSTGSSSLAVPAV